MGYAPPHPLPRAPWWRCPPGHIRRPPSSITAPAARLVWSFVLYSTFAKALFCRRRRRASGAFEGPPALKPVFDSPYACTVRQVGPQECKERNFALSDCQNVRISVSQRGARGMASSAPSSSRGAAATLRPEQRRQRSLRARRCRRRPAAAAAGGGSAKAAHINWTNDAECKCVVLRALMRIDVLGLRGDLLGACLE